MAAGEVCADGHQRLRDGEHGLPDGGHDGPAGRPRLFAGGGHRQGEAGLMLSSIWMVRRYAQVVSRKSQSFLAEFAEARPLLVVVSFPFLIG